MFGTWEDDAIRGSSTDGDGIINGLSGDDVIYGTDRNETLYNQTGDALLYGGGGNDNLWAGEGNDILDGGPGNDALQGEAGNDTYIFRKGSGRDNIADSDPTPGNVDTIWLGDNLAPSDITLKRSHNDLSMGSSLLLAHDKSENGFIASPLIGM
jgi:Ca2+-binding RTX toxin-like protein